MSYHPDSETDALAAAYRDAYLGLLKKTASMRAAKKAEDAYGNRLRLLGCDEVRIAATMYRIVKEDVLPLYRAHLRLLGEIGPGD